MLDNIVDRETLSSDANDSQDIHVSAGVQTMSDVDRYEVWKIIAGIKDEIKNKKSKKKHYLEPSALARAVLEDLQLAYEVHNNAADKGYKWKIPQRLSNQVIADLLMNLYEIKLIDFTGFGDADRALLAIYDDETGVYDVTQRKIKKLIREFEYNTSVKDSKEIITLLEEQVETVDICRERDLIPLANGIFDYKTKTLREFSPEYVFINKCMTAYNKNAVDTVIHNDEDGTDWTVEGWFNTLSDDAEVVDLLWKIVGATLRPNVSWNKSAWFFSTKGNNGKGTLCSLMRNILGKGQTASIPLSAFGKEFMLETLITKNAIIVDENDVGEYIDKAANLKAIITNDVIEINRKFKTPISFQFHGFMVQCMNELPSIKDTTDSFYRRQLYIPFEKCFTGQERSYIKSDYLCRKEVLEYVVFRVLNMPAYYELNCPDSCVELLNNVKLNSNPVAQFWADVKDELVWSVVPNTFLYDLYKSWFSENCPSGILIKRLRFMDEMKRIIGDDWSFVDVKNVNSDNPLGLDKPEPLILKYNLVKWQRGEYRGQNRDLICTLSKISSQYRNVYVRNESVCEESEHED